MMYRHAQELERELNELGDLLQLYRGPDPDEGTPASDLLDNG